jgi:large subunit ribosomal protein L29
MKAKLWQETKSLSSTEIAVKLRESEEALFRLRFRHASTPVKNALEIRNLRRMIARYKTLMKEQSRAAQAGK